MNILEFFKIGPLFLSDMHGILEPLIRHLSHPVGDRIRFQFFFPLQLFSVHPVLNIGAENVNQGCYIRKVRGRYVTQPTLQGVSVDPAMF